MSIQFDYIEGETNPLDSVEELMEDQNWVFSRMSDEELMVQVTGKSSTYSLFFLWQEDMQALQFCAQYDFSINDDQMDKAARALMTINKNIWMGHFEIPKDTMSPAFRYTGLYKGLQTNSSGGTSHMKDLIDIAMAQCEKHYAAFYLLSHANDSHDQNMALALMETAGES